MTLQSSGRHLANIQAPPNILGAYVTNITGSAPNVQISIHLAASPNSPVAKTQPTNQYVTLFIIDKLQSGAYWQAGWFYTYNPVINDTLTTANQSFSNGQHLYEIRGQTQNSVFTNGYRYLEILPNGTNGTPHLVADYPSDPDATILSYCMPRAQLYEVYEDHGIQTTLTYRGPDCNILVHRIMPAPDTLNEYYVKAKYADTWPNSTGGWSPPSGWLILSF